MKKSRVERFKDLHREIASDAESSVENSNLSDFAKRLNEIDSQFEQIQTSEKDDSEQAVRARKHAESDSEYLQNFLDEVKAYNVKKGYRHHEDTQTNLLNEIREELRDSEVEYFDHVQEEQDLKDEAVQSVDLNIEEEALPTEAKLFGEGILEEAEKPEDISNAVKELVDEIEEGANDFDSKIEPLDSFEEEDAQDLALDSDDFDDLSLQEELLSQTQTLQHKIIDQERNIDEMSEKMARTNRLLNVILSFLIFAIIVIILIIVKQFLQF